MDKEENTMNIYNSIDEIVGNEHRGIDNGLLSKMVVCHHGLPPPQNFLGQLTHISTGGGLPPMKQSHQMVQHTVKNTLEIQQSSDAYPGQQVENYNGLQERVDATGHQGTPIHMNYDVEGYTNKQTKKALGDNHFIYLTDGQQQVLNNFYDSTTKEGYTTCMELAVNMAYKKK